MQSIISLLYIGIGGFLGAISRWGLGNTIKKIFNEGNFPFSTLIINLLGCFGIGLAYAIWENNNNAKLLLIIGFLCGFTTFSTFAHEVLLLIKNGNTLYAVFYVILSSVLGVMLVSLGMKLSS